MEEFFSHSKRIILEIPFSQIIFKFFFLKIKIFFKKFYLICTRKKKIKKNFSVEKNGKLFSAVGGSLAIALGVPSDDGRALDILAIPETLLQSNGCHSDLPLGLGGIE